MNSERREGLVGLAKNFVGGFPLHPTDKPERTFWPTQYTSLRPVASTLHSLGTRGLHGGATERLRTFHPLQSEHPYFSLFPHTEFPGKISLKEKDLMQKKMFENYSFKTIFLNYLFSQIGL